MRAANYLWWCPSGHKNGPSDKECHACKHKKMERHAQVHASERAVVYYNPATGEHRTPARADQPMPAVYSNQGFERREILSMTGWEREAGVVHEPTNFNSGNEVISTDPPPLKHKPELIKALARDFADAAATGFTGTDRLL